MTLAEFKAWFEGFTDGIADAPTPEQWVKIKDKVAQTVAISLADDVRRSYQIVPPVFAGQAGGQIGVLSKPDPDHKIAG